VKGGKKPRPANGGTKLETGRECDKKRPRVNKKVGNLKNSPQGKGYPYDNELKEGKKVDQESTLR